MTTRRIEYNGHFGDISELQGAVTVTPSGENEGVSTALARVDIGPDDSKEGRMSLIVYLMSLSERRKQNLTNIYD